MAIIEYVLILYSVINLVCLIRQYKQLHCIYPIIILFDAVFVLPLFLELIWGIPDIPRDVYWHYIKALEDVPTLKVYCFFIFFAQATFSVELRRIKRRTRKLKKTNDIKKTLIAMSNFKYKKALLCGCYLIVFITVMSIVFSPDPVYFLKLHSVFDAVPLNLYQYKFKIINPISELLVFAIILLKLFDAKNGFLSSGFRLLLIAFYTVINGKRTYLMVIVGTFFLIDVLRTEKIKKIIPKYLVLFSATAFYFVAYAYITDKISYNSDWYYELNEYIFRSMHMRFAIYAELNPDKVHVLDYHGQALLSDLLYFVPRSIWPNKPYPYLDYYMMGLMNITQSKVTYHMPMSYYPEFVSNFGLIGAPLSILFSKYICRYFDNCKPLCRLMGLALISLLNIYYYNDLLKIVALVILAACIMDKYKFKMGTLRL